MFYSVPLQKGQTAELRPKALALMLAAGFILLIACANLAGVALYACCAALRDSNPAGSGRFARPDSEATLG